MIRRSRPGSKYRDQLGFARAGLLETTDGATLKYCLDNCIGLGLQEARVPELSARLNCQARTLVKEYLPPKYIRRIANSPSPRDPGVKFRIFLAYGGIEAVPRKDLGVL